jgi:CHAD domain-containing protein/transposase-like protein
MTNLILNPEDLQQLEQIAAHPSHDSAQRKAQLVLLYDQGLPTRDVALEVGLSRGRARYWRHQYELRGMGIFASASQEPEGSPDTELQPAPGEVLGALPPEEMAASGLRSEQLILKSPGVLPDDSLAEAGRKVLRFHFVQMLRKEAGTRDGGDIEDLHDMRVATRRMRAAFEVFEDAFTSKAIRTHLKGLRATGRTLGRVRDLDVFMEKAHHYLDSLPEEHRDGLRPLLHSWEQTREAGRQVMVNYLDSREYEAFKLRFDDFLNTAGAGARHVHEATPNLVREVAPGLIYERYATVRAFDTVLESATLEQFHALRIEFKKLRYTVEYFREVLGPQAGDVIEELKVLQDHLGDLNDANVASHLLRDFLAEWDVLQARLPVEERQTPEPILDYMAYRYAERQRLMLTFAETWKRFNSPEFRQNLALAVSVL